LPHLPFATPHTATPPVAPPQLTPRPRATPPAVASVKPPQVLPRPSRDANRFYRQGRDLSEQENFEAAVQAFDQALEIDPTHALALNARGYAQLRLRNYQGAIDDCTQAIRLNPSYANAYVNRSVARRASGDVPGAREDLRRAIELGSVAQNTIKTTRP
jgi:tetratricopeptide (TPR) repeat protein